MKPTAKLDKWSILPLSNGKVRYLGIVSGHPKLKDGEEIFTSELISKFQDGDEIASDAPAGQWRIETRNTIYILGEPDSGLAVKYGLATN